MSGFKWSAKGLRLIGELLEPGDVDSWFSSEGGDSFTETMKRLPLPWFFGHTRAKNRIVRDISKGLKQSATFRASLEAELEKLPWIIGRASTLIRAKFPGIFTDTSEEVSHEEPDWLGVIPRVIVLELYTWWLRKELSDAAELAHYTGLSDYYLKNKAVAAERSFSHFVKNKNYHVIDTDKMILNIDLDYRWITDGLPGHYYFARSFQDEINLKRRRHRKRLQKRFDERLQQMRARLGKMSTAKRQTYTENVEDAIEQFHSLTD